MTDPGIDWIYDVDGDDDETVPVLFMDYFVDPDEDDDDGDRAGVGRHQQPHPKPQFVATDSPDFRLMWAKFRQSGMSQEQFKAGLTHATSKLLAGGAKWTVSTGTETTSYPRALVALRDRLLFADAKGTLTLRDTADGREVLTAKLEPLAWDGAAATPGQLFVTTSTGRILCLGAK